MSKKLKLLCMHGFGTNKKFMKTQAKSIQSQLSEIADFIYVDGPFTVPMENVLLDGTVLNHLQGESRSWFSNNLSKTRTLKQILQNLQEIRVAIQKANIHFDGAFCFSQGAMVFQMICLYHKLGHINWQCLKNIKFFINFSPVAVKYSYSLSPLNWQRFQIPSIHILSNEDIYFQSLMVHLTRFKAPQIIFHFFGHKLPIFAHKQKQKIMKFIKRHGFDNKENSIIFKSRL